MFELDAINDPEHRKFRICWVVEADDQIIGNIGLWFFIPQGLESIFNAQKFKEGKWAQLGRAIDSSAWGKGIGTNIAQLVAEIGFRDLKLEGLVTKTLKSNLAARRSIEKAGFKFIKENDTHAFFVMTRESNGGL